MFAGHFPGNPLVPGVILVEALAQTAGITAASGYPEDQKPMFLLSAIRSMKFLRPVRPGQRVQLFARKEGEIDGLFQMRVHAVCEGGPVAEGQIVLTTVKP